VKSEASKWMLSAGSSFLPLCYINIIMYIIMHIIILWCVIQINFFLMMSEYSPSKQEQTKQRKEEIFNFTVFYWDGCDWSLWCICDRHWLTGLLFSWCTFIFLWPVAQYIPDWAVHSHVMVFLYTYAWNAANF
jgi:hypothetical protein